MIRRSYILTLLLILSIPVHSQTELPDSLVSVLDTTASDKKKAEIFSQLAFRSLPEDFSHSLAYGYLSLEFAQKAKDQELIAKAYNDIGNTYAFLSMNELAIEYYKQALNIIDTLPQSKRKSRLHAFIGQSYKDMHQYDSALVNIQYAKQYSLNDTSGTWWHILELFAGELYSKTGSPDSALKNLNQALRYFESVNNMNLVQESYLYLSELYDAISDRNKAIRTLEKAEKTGINPSATHTFISIEQSLAGYYINQKRIKKAKSRLQLADSLLNLKTYPDLMAVQHQLYARFFELTKDFKNAFYERKRYLNIKDSLDAVKLKNIQDLMEIRYETESKTTELDLLEQEYEIGLLKERKKQVLRNISIIIVILLGLSAVMLIIFLILKNQTTKKLSQKKQELQKLNNNLKIKEDERKKEKQVRDKLFSIITHNLINPFNILLGFTSILSEDIQEYSREEIKRYAGLIHESSKRLQFLLENLLQWSRLQMKRVNIHPAYIDIRKVIDRLLPSFHLISIKKNIIFDIQLPEESIVFADESLTEIVLKNLVHNAIKYSYPNGKIEIRGIRTKDKLQISIKDYGTGITDEDRTNLFNLDNHFSRKGTMGEDGTGLGLLICKEILEMHDSTLTINSEVSKGSTFTFSLPLKRKKEPK